MYIACFIYNNSLGQAFQVNDLQAGIEKIIEMATSQLGSLSEDHLEDANTIHEISDLSDSDNLYTWSVGIVD